MAITDRPMVTLSELSELAGIDDDGETRRLCQSYGILVGSDGMMSVSAIVMFFRALNTYSRAAAFDRIHLLLWAFSIDDECVRRPPPSYDVKLEAEVRRISKLDEPAKSMQAVLLLERFVDVEKIVGDGKCVAFIDRLRKAAGLQYKKRKLERPMGI